MKGYGNICIMLLVCYMIVIICYDFVIVMVIEEYRLLLLWKW